MSFPLAWGADTSVTNLSALASREGIMRMQEVCIANADPSVSLLERFPLKHWFCSGIYSREMIIQKGSVIIGNIHKYPCMNVVLKGRIAVLTEEGEKEFQAGDIFPSPAGIKRAGKAHEETVWVTFHATEKTDPEVIEEEITFKTFEEYDRFVEEQKLLENKP